MDYPKPMVRETTLFIESSYRRARVAMPTLTQVVYLESGELGAEFREVSRGTFPSEDKAMAYYYAKVDKLHAAGWRTLSFA